MQHIAPPGQLRVHFPQPLVTFGVPRRLLLPRILETVQEHAFFLFAGRQIRFCQACLSLQFLRLILQVVDFRGQPAEAAHGPFLLALQGAAEGFQVRPQPVPAFGQFRHGRRNGRHFRQQPMLDVPLVP